MAKKVSYVDEDGNELIFHINTHNKLFITAGDSQEFYTGHICLDKEDLCDFIEDLKVLLSEMQ
jgi:hypothetical protein